LHKARYFAFADWFKKNLPATEKFSSRNRDHSGYASHDLLGVMRRISEISDVKSGEAEHTRVSILDRLPGFPPFVANGDRNFLAGSAISGEASMHRHLVYYDCPQRITKAVPAQADL